VPRLTGGAVSDNTIYQGFHDQQCGESSQAFRGTRDNIADAMARQTLREKLRKKSYVADDPEVPALLLHSQGDRWIEVRSTRLRLYSRCNVLIQYRR